ncbi:MAG: hypothetical protein WCA08_17400 [Desulfoferrobacter sp.]
MQSSAAKIRLLETEAQEALFERNDNAAYERKLREKTLLLLDLPETLHPLLEGVKTDEADKIRSRIAGFSRRAEPALELSSTFYMSALLYPEDYKPGEMNDLEKLIEDIRKKYAFRD